MERFIAKRRIYYHDTDCGGVVYYANYLKYFEEARTRHLLELGIDLRATAAEGMIFAVSAVEIRYRAPARYGDEISILSCLKRVRPASVVFSHEIKRGDEVLVECTTTLAAINRDFEPVAMLRRVADILQGAAQAAAPGR